MAHSPFQGILAAASRSKAELNQALQWLLLITRSGVELPSDLLERITDLVVAHPASLDDAQVLTHTILLSFWLKSLGRQGLQSLFARLFVALDKSILGAGTDEKTALSDTRFVEQWLRAIEH